MAARHLEPMSRIVAAPAQSGNQRLRPGVQVAAAVGRVGIGLVAADESRGSPKLRQAARNNIVTSRQAPWPSANVSSGGRAAPLARMSWRMSANSRSLRRSRNFSASPPASSASFAAKAAMAAFKFAAEVDGIRRRAVRGLFGLGGLELEAAVDAKNLRFSPEIELA